MNIKRVVVTRISTEERPLHHEWVTESLSGGDDVTVTEVGPGQWHVWNMGERVCVGTDITGAVHCAKCKSFVCAHVQAVLEDNPQLFPKFTAY